MAKRVSASQLKDIVKNVRYTSEEWKAVQGKLDASGLSFSEFIRKASLQASVTTVSAEALDLLINVRMDIALLANEIQICLGDDSLSNNADLQKIENSAKLLFAKLDSYIDSLV